MRSCKEELCSRWLLRISPCETSVRSLWAVWLDLHPQPLMVCSSYHSNRFTSSDRWRLILSCDGNPQSTACISTQHTRPEIAKLSRVTCLSNFVEVHLYLYYGDTGLGLWQVTRYQYKNLSVNYQLLQANVTIVSAQKLRRSPTLSLISRHV
jgi:hypothetical protein